MENIKIKNSKGKNIAVAVNYPEVKTDKLVILCPGFLDSKDYNGLLKLSEILAEQGYVAVRFDPTGTWESEGDISEYTMTQYLDDIKSVLEYMLSLSDYKHILLGGHSRGGQMSLLYAARDSKISSVLAIMPSSGPITGEHRQEWEKDKIKISSRDLPNDINKKREFRVPFSHVLDRDQYDVVSDVKKIKVSIIFIAAELDEFIPVEDVKELYNNANEPKKFILIENIGHNYRRNLDEVKIVNNKIIETLTEFI